jgi:putative transposase
MVLKEELIGLLYSLADILHSLRANLQPVVSTLPKLGNMALKLSTIQMLAPHSVVPLVECNAVIVDTRRSIYSTFEVPVPLVRVDLKLHRFHAPMIALFSRYQQAIYKMETVYRHYRHSVGCCTVHLVWIPCRRKKVFKSNEALKLRCIEVFHSVANDKKWIIKAIEVASDHVHLLVEYDPHHSISQVVKAFKGRSSRFLRQEFPVLLRLPSLWTHSFMFDSTGKVSTQKVLEYINDPHHG